MAQFGRKRNRKNRSSTDSSSSQEQVDLKRCKKLLSISSSEDESLDKEDNMANGKQIMEELKKMNTRMDKLKDEIVKSVQDTMGQRLNSLEKRVQELEKENVELKKELKETREGNVPQRILQAEKKIVEMEQYSRCCNIKVMGIHEDESEDTFEKVLKVFKDTMKLDVQKGDLLAAHHNPTVRDIRPRPIIVKFLRRHTQETVVRARSRLKGTKIVIYEDLCRELQLVLNRVKKDPRVSSCWSWRGRIS